MLQMWGGVVVWNAQSCLKNLESKGPVRHMISPKVYFSFADHYYFDRIFADHYCLSISYPLEEKVAFQS